MNLAARLSALPGDAPALLRAACRVAAEAGSPAYLVGGAVRDLLLGRPVTDLDIVVEGDALEVAATLAATGTTTLHLHERFGTARIVWSDGHALDLITARREHYPAPGTLPVVSPGTLTDDLRRRDFTINALAIALAPEQWGQLIDPLGGRADLDAGLVRALHPASFGDDPTRVPRAARYEQRLSLVAPGASVRRYFMLEPATLGWLREAVAAGALALVSVDRLQHEFQRLLGETRAAAMVARLAEFDALRWVDRRFRWDAGVAGAFARLALTATWSPEPVLLWQARLALLLVHLSAGEAAEASRRLHLTADAAATVRDLAALRSRLPRLAAPLANSVLATVLEDFSVTALVAFAASRFHPVLWRNVERYLCRVRALRPVLGGDNLRTLGIPPGPIYRDALAALRAFRRDHPEATVEEETALLHQWLVARGLLPVP